MKKMPTSVVVQCEISGYCNLRCKMCAYPVMKRKKGFMSEETFAKVLQHCASGMEVPRVRLFVFGEPLLHPQLEKFLQMAKQARVITDIATNGVAMDREVGEMLIRNDVAAVNFSIDGSCEEENRKIRIGNARWAQVVANVLGFRQLVQAARSKLKITVSTIVMDDTIKTIGKTIKFWKERGVSLKVQPVFTQAGLVEDLGSIARKQHNVPVKTVQACREPWNKIVVYWDGSVGFCCSDAEGTLRYTNVTEMDFVEAYFGEARQRIQRDFHEGRIPLCNGCELYPPNYRKIRQ